MRLPVYITVLTLCLTPRDTVCQDFEDRLIFCCSEDEEETPMIDMEEPMRISQKKCLEYSQCDELPIKMSLVGGFDADPGEFPHMAAIGWKTAEGDGHSWMCGGSLISDQFILTAAHCLFSRGDGLLNPYPDTVRLGALYLNKQGDVEEEGLQQLEIVDFIPHPDYSPPSKYHDIGLLKLTEPVKITKFVRPLCLWDNETIDNAFATATGWGKVNYTGPSTNTLNKVDLFFVEQETCEKALGSRRSIRRGIIEEQICAGQHGKDSCQGDSGGPLTLQSKNKRCIYHQVGITSFGVGCGTEVPAVYTRVYSYLDWIESIVWT